MNAFLAEKEKAKQKIFEATLEYAASCHVENINIEIQAQEQLDGQIPFPPELDVKMRKLIADYNKKRGLKKVWKTARRVLTKIAVFVLIVLSGLTVFVMSVEAFRVKVLNFVMEEAKEYTSIGMQKEADIQSNNSNAIPPNWEGMYAPTYIPKGFTIIEAKTFTEVNRIIYSNDIGQIIAFEQCNDENTSLRVDTENAKTTKIMINKFEGLLIEKAESIIIVWYNGDASFTFKAEIDIGELLKVAESVQIAK